LLDGDLFNTECVLIMQEIQVYCQIDCIIEYK
jgi:hypothetical protein